MPAGDRAGTRRRGVSGLCLCGAGIGPSRTGLAMYLGSPYGELMAGAALGERPQWYQLLGIAPFLPGLFLATRPRPARADGCANGWTVGRRRSYE